VLYIIYTFGAVYYIYLCELPKLLWQLLDVVAVQVKSVQRGQFADGRWHGSQLILRQVPNDEQQAAAAVAAMVQHECNSHGKQNTQKKGALLRKDQSCNPASLHTDWSHSMSAVKGTCCQHMCMQMGFIPALNATKPDSNVSRSDI